MFLIIFNLYKLLDFNIIAGVLKGNLNVDIDLRTYQNKKILSEPLKYIKLVLNIFFVTN